MQLSDLAKVIELDPALVTKLFRAANSPLYGMRRQATNLRQVLNLLGLQGTLALALGFSLISSSQTASVIPLDIEPVSYTHLDVYKRQGLHGAG